MTGTFIGFDTKFISITKRLSTDWWSLTFHGCWSILKSREGIAFIAKRYIFCMHIFNKLFLRQMGVNNTKPWAPCQGLVSWWASFHLSNLPLFPEACSLAVVHYLFSYAGAAMCGLHCYTGSVIQSWVKENLTPLPKANLCATSWVCFILWRHLIYAA